MLLPVWVEADLDIPRETIAAVISIPGMTVDVCTLEAKTIEDRRAFYIIINIVHAVMDKVQRGKDTGESMVKSPGDIVVGIPRIERYATRLLCHIKIIAIVDEKSKAVVTKYCAVDINRCIHVIPHGITIQIFSNKTTAMKIKRDLKTAACPNDAEEHHEADWNKGACDFFIHYQ
jgi:hypothetical protein